PRTFATYTLSLHDALPISLKEPGSGRHRMVPCGELPMDSDSLEHTLRKHFLPLLPQQWAGVGEGVILLVRELSGVQYQGLNPAEDRKSTRLNSSHDQISYA